MFVTATGEFIRFVCNVIIESGDGKHSVVGFILYSNELQTHLYICIYVHVRVPSWHRSKTKRHQID